METKGTLESEELPVDGETAAWIKEKALAILLPGKSYGDLRVSSVVSIFRVPNFLKESKNEKAFVPQIVSLGPYHSNRPQLSPMDNHKKRVVRRMMTRFNNRRGATDPDNLEFSFRAIEKIFQDVENIKNSYDENINCTPECLAVMLTLDGCFILERLRTLDGDDLIWGGSCKYEPIFDINFTGFDILHDILKIENQIPLIVLRKLLQLEFDSVDRAHNFLFEVLVKTAGLKFYPFDYDDDMEKWSWPQPVEQVHHFLGLLYRLIVSPTPNDGHQRAIQIGNNGKQKGIHTAVQLSNAGIKFQRCNGGIKKIDFDRRKATIYLPPINVTRHTEVLFSNLTALELYKASGINYVTCYLNLMNELIDTEEDVALLRHSAVLDNYMGSDEEVVALFNGLCKGVALPREDIFQRLQNNVMKHYESIFKVWFAQFVSAHWRTLAFHALVLTLVQTIFSILEYYK